MSAVLDVVQIDFVWWIDVAQLLASSVIKQTHKQLVNMLWFNGSIPDAIHSAKQRSSVFVVVITGTCVLSISLLANVRL